MKSNRGSFNEHTLQGLLELILAGLGLQLGELEGLLDIEDHLALTLILTLVLLLGRRVGTLEGEVNLALHVLLAVDLPQDIAGDLNELVGIGDDLVIGEDILKSGYTCQRSSKKKMCKRKSPHEIPAQPVQRSILNFPSTRSQRQRDRSENRNQLRTGG